MVENHNLILSLSESQLVLVSYGKVHQDISHYVREVEVSSMKTTVFFALQPWVILRQRIVYIGVNSIAMSYIIDSETIIHGLSRGSVEMLVELGTWNLEGSNIYKKRRHAVNRTKF